MIFIRASISIKELNIDMLIKILESEGDETNPYFFQLKQLILCIFSYWSVPTQLIQNSTLLIVLFLYLAIIVLDNSLFLVGSISVLRDNYYFWQTRCTCRKKSSNTYPIKSGISIHKAKDFIIRSIIYQSINIW